MKTPNFTRQRGFTLVEMTVVIAFGMALSSAGLMLLNQQINTVRIFNEQDFLLKEAPRINNTLTSLLNRADAIRLHSSFSDAIQDQNPVLANGKVLVAAFRNVDNTVTFGLINFENSGGLTSLNYYFFDPSQTPPTLGSPSWTISRNVAYANFDLVEGLFRCTLSGPNQEQISYTISPNR